MTKARKPKIMTVHVTSDRVEIKTASAFAAFVRVQNLSPSAIPLYAWPEDVYAGRVDRWTGERRRFYIIDPRTWVE